MTTHNSSNDFVGIENFIDEKQARHRSQVADPKDENNTKVSFLIKKQQ